IAVLVFALLLGNFGELSKRLGVQGEFALDPTLRAFQVEVSFFVRTFFFIFTGLMFNLESMRSTALTMALAVFGIILLTRIIGVKLLVFRDRNMAHSEKAMISMMPRGLAAAVLASMPLAAGINIPYFVEIVFSTIILTNMATAFGIFAVERKLAANARIASQADII
ncbi:MAG: cation:proton antiporter, partial [Euryarchaeota archaeon]|nr:cation:proton antiporter [Euryarchaeota archaeon]